MKRLATAIFVSGRGSNMEALIKAAKDPSYPARIDLVFSNTPKALGLGFARAAGVETLVIDHRDFGEDRVSHERAIDGALRQRGVELVALAGYMRILTPYLTGRWTGRMLNIHPSLLPKHPGLHTHERALAAGDAEAGCTVHLVTEGVDEGPILGQSRIPIMPGDDPQSLATRILIQEHILYPRCLADVARSLMNSPA